MAKKDQPEVIEVRLLADCGLGKCNDVVEIAPDQIDAFSGLVDSNPAAVKYAKGLKNE